MGRWSLLLLLAALTAALAAAQPRVELYDSYWRAPPQPGANGTLVVSLRYTGPSGNVAVRANLTIRGVAGRDLLSSANYSGYLSSGALLPLEFTLSIPQGPLASYYPALLRVDCNGSLTVISFQVGFGGEPSFSVTASTSVLRRGESNSITLAIAVLGAPARNVEVRVTPASPLVTVIGGSLRRVGLVQVGETLQLPLTVLLDSAAGEGVALTVTISYEDYVREPGSQVLTIGFQTETPVGLPHFSCAAHPSRIPSGQRTPVTLYIANVGRVVAKDVKLTISPMSPGVAILSGSSATLGDMPPGASAATTVVLRADRMVAGVAQLQVVLSYYDKYGNSRVATLSVGLEVTRSPSPLLAVRPLNASVPSGVNAVVAAEVVNIGDAAALDVVVDAVPVEGVYILGQSRFRIERLEPRRSALVKLLIRTVPLSSSATLSFGLRYYDGQGYSYSDAIRVSLNLTAVSPNLVVKPLNRSLYSNRVNRVLLAVRNEGRGRAVNASVVLTSQSPEIGAVIGPSTVTLGVVEPNSSRLVEFEVFVQPRVYGALQLLAAALYSSEGDRPYRDLFTLGFEVRGDWELSIALVVTMPPVVFPGDSLVRLAVTLVNSGDYMARNVEVKLVGSKWVRPSSASAAEAFIPYLPVGQTATLMFLVDIDENAPVGNHRLLINASGRQLTFTLTVLEKARFAVRNVSRLDVERGGRGYRLVYEVVNESNSTTRDVRVEIFSPFLRGTISVYVGTLLPYERKSVVFEVDVDSATPLGELPVDIKVGWTQEGRTLLQYVRRSLYVREPRGVDPLAILAAAAVAAALLAWYKRSALRELLERLSAATRKKQM